MKRVWASLLLGVGLGNIAWCGSRAAASHEGKASLTPEQVQVYGDFIESLSKTNFKYVENRTFPLDLSGIGKDAACLRGLRLQEAEESSKAVHSLGPEVLRGHSIRLIDEQGESAILKQWDAEVAAHGVNSMMDASGMIKDPGVLALSEIAFDESHRFAILKYVFLCGSHCNSGATLVLEKVGSRWNRNDQAALQFRGRQSCQSPENR